ncbi:MAG: transcriptional activator RfaH [Bryobacterales bacterium]|jgi:transcription antitermination factor NusG|nr:transcriptional activator RfaH [Bryobacterales bacterium]
MNTRPQQDLAWFALRIRPKFARVASQALSGKDYETFLPVYSSCRQWSDRRKLVDLPLFPGYLFCRFNPRDRLMPILTTPGVIAIVSAGHDPVSIPDGEVEAIKTIIQSGLPAEPWPLLTVGSIVLIDKGPLSGIEGITLDVNRGHRLIVSIPLLQRSIAVEIERHWVRPVVRPVATRVGLAPAADHTTPFQRI